MRILVYNWRDLAHPRAGGAEVYTHNVARHWVKLGHEVTWFTSAVAGRPGEEVLDGIRIVRRGGRVGVYREARAFYLHEGAGRFDVVLDEINTRPFMTPTFVADAPVVALIHQVCREVWFYETNLPLALVGRYVLEPRWLRRYRDTPIITVSESSRASLERYGLSDVTVIREGFSVPALDSPPARDTRPTVMFLGRLQGNKRPQHALEAFELARRELPELRMRFVGAGPLEARLKRRAGPSVQFFGRADDCQKYELLARSHALVVTSVREGWGLVVTEAAAVGTPAIAYDVAGLRDSVQAARGTLVAPHPSALGKAIVAHFARPQAVAAVDSLYGTQPWADAADQLLESFNGVLVKS